MGLLVLMTTLPGASTGFREKRFLHKSDTALDGNHPVQWILKEQSDDAFTEYFGFDVSSFQKILSYDSLVFIMKISIDLVHLLH